MPLDDIAGYWPEVLNLLCGSLIGAWIGATWATRMDSATLYRVLAVLLAFIAAALVANHARTIAPLSLPQGVEIVAGVIAGAGIGVVAALMGVAGGELLIPTFVLLYAVDIKVAGSLSLAVSLPTMLVAFARYSRDGSFVVLRQNRRFVLTMATGSVVGTLIGGALVGVISASMLIPVLVVLLLASSVKVWPTQHGRHAAVAVRQTRWPPARPSLLAQSHSNAPAHGCRCQAIAKAAETTAACFGRRAVIRWRATTRSPTFLRRRPVGWCSSPAALKSRPSCRTTCGA